MVLEHIQKLLFDHDCVIMPDFGGLITHYEPAKIHPVRHTFSPPAKRVAFNEKLKINDGLLISTLAYDNKLSADEAQRQVTRFVQELQRELNQNRKFDLKGIGIFRLNEESKVVFEYVENENYLSDSFGLPELLAKPVLAAEPVILRTLLKDQNQPAKVGFRNKINRYYRAATALVIGGVVVTGLYLLSLQTDYNVSAINPITLFQTDSAKDFDSSASAENDYASVKNNKTVEVQPVIEAASNETGDLVVDSSDLVATNNQDRNFQTEEASKIIRIETPTSEDKKQSSDKKLYTIADPKKLEIAPGEAVLISAKANPPEPAPKEEVRRNFTTEEINAALSANGSKIKPESISTAKPPVPSVITNPKPLNEALSVNKNTARPEISNEKTGSAGSTTIKPKAERFYVIVNGYSTYESAERNRKIIAKKGRSGQIIAPFGGAKLYRIAIAEYDSRELAMQNLPELKNKYGNTIWILKR
ncbi:HU domain-containing protein [Adhaeribacter pallidiroseus]|uniref:SPOR domain-containing protein n=1 Tax=Adhaeribacter pallidiroseus TaxID=2072847 RepID=A0A369QDR5_9BACT|nr:SPOR domain-containing protein [Adhaeribacter pallidiroseus]RDC63063.1 hypothetical protein AHMF7616_01663 [Adhaeribacter pallidiroseus]